VRADVQAAPVQLAAAAPAMTNELASDTASENEAAPVQTAAAEAAPAASEPAPAPASRMAFAEVAAAISSLPVEAERTPAVSRPAATRPRPATTQARNGSTTAARTPAAATRAPAAATRSAANSRPARTPQQTHPARIWVQLATAARPALAGEYSRLTRIAPELLRGRNAFAATSGTSSSRLLVGPFATQAEARAFINRLNQEDINSFAWSSTAGQQVEALSAGRR